MLFLMNLLHKAHVSLNMSKLQGKKKQKQKKSHKNKKQNITCWKWGSGKQGTQLQNVLDVANVALKNCCIFLLKLIMVSLA